jgi:predicted esterase
MPLEAFHGRGRFRALLLAVLLLSGRAGPLGAQEDAEVLRQRIALSYLQFELALRSLPEADAARRAELNRGFDRITAHFLAGNLRGALAVLDTLLGEVTDGSRGGYREAAVARLSELDGARRVERVGGEEVAYLVHVPSGPVPAGGWPVVVAVHGAGGDERMFFGGYGGGSIRVLADRHGVAVLTPAAPLTTEVLLGLVDAVAAEHGLDGSRIGLLGHSMGAGVVTRAASEQPSRIRAVVCVAGNCSAAASPGSRIPIFIAAGALDPLFRVDVLSALAESLTADGRTVVFRRLESEGHTLVVGQVLPEAMEWLAARLR